MAILLADGGILAAVCRKGRDFEEHPGEGEEKSQEDECLISLFLAAADERGRVEVAVLLVVVLRGKDEGREPEV